VSEWLKRESNDRDERNRVFRATIAAASDDAVRVDCDSITLVFTRFVPGKAPVVSAYQCIYVARQAIAGAGQHSAMYVSVDSFAERVNESDRSNFESAITDHVTTARS
jgi:hypothetical protein